MKGFWYMIEAIIAGIIIVSFLVVITQRVLILAPEEDITIRGYEILKGLDEQGVLVNYTITEDFNGLNSEIQFFAFNHTVQICRENGDCVGIKPNATNRYVSTYLVAGNSTYIPYEVRLYIF